MRCAYPGYGDFAFFIRLRQASLFIRYAEEREQHGSAEPCSAGASPIIGKPPRDWKSRHLRSPGKRSAPGSLIRVQMANSSKPPVFPRLQRCLLPNLPGAPRLPGLRGLRFLIKPQQASLFTRYAEEREQRGSAEPCSAGASPIICKPPRDWKSRHLRSPGKRSAPGSLIRVQMANRSKPPVSPHSQRCLLTDFPGALRLPGLHRKHFAEPLRAYGRSAGRVIPCPYFGANKDGCQSVGGWVATPCTANS